MWNKLLIGAGVVLSIAGCQPKCENSAADANCPGEPDVIKLAESSDHIKQLFLNEKSHIRGMKVGMPLSSIAEADSNIFDTTSFYISYTPDLSFNYWADVEYQFDKNSIVDKVVTEIIPSGLGSAENTSLADSVFFELSDYLSGRFGQGVTNTDFARIWNEVGTNENGSLTVFKLEYKFPETDFSLELNPETGLKDTVYNPPTVEYTVKYIE